MYFRIELIYLTQFPYVWKGLQPDPKKISN